MPSSPQPPTPPRKDKQKVFDEVWSDDRVRGFLSAAPPAGIDPDYNVLEKAYRSMRPEDFERLVAFFVAEGRNLHAPGPQGQSLLEVMRQHRKAAPYRQAIENAAR